MNFNDATLKKILGPWLTQVELREICFHEISGGLSGAQLWRVSCAEQNLCLRRWPEVHPTQEELTQIHSLITHVWNSGIHIVALPRLTRLGQSFVHSAGNLFELTDWMPGEKLEHLAASQTNSALTTLALFHEAAATHAVVRSGPAPGLVKRLTILNHLREVEVAQLEQAIRVASTTPLRAVALTMLTDLQHTLPTAFEIVKQASRVTYQLQWCLRDIHRGNLLFINDQVSGLVDFGAAAIDSVAGDVARLVGSIAGDDAHIWRTCLATFVKNQPLTDEELTAVAAYDIGGLVASSANWLRWLFVEQREFADLEAIQTRLSELAQRLRSLAERSGRSVLAVSQGFEM